MGLRHSSIAPAVVYKAVKTAIQGASFSLPAARALTDRRLGWQRAHVAVLALSLVPKGRLEQAVPRFFSLAVGRINHVDGVRFGDDPNNLFEWRHLTITHADYFLTLLWR